VSVLAGFDVGGVDPHVRVGAFQRSVSETLDLLIELLAHFGDSALGDARHAQSLRQLIHLTGRDAVDVGLLDNRR
jgi:hypothetical protein